MNARRATAADSNAIAQVHVASWQSAYGQLLPHDYLASLSVEERAAIWAKAAETGTPAVLVAEAEGQVVGFVAYGKPRDESPAEATAEVWAINVHPGNWRKGFGQLLLSAAIGELTRQGYKTTYLWVIVGNDRATLFYKQFGFVLEQSARKYFQLAGTQVGEDKLVIVLPQNAA